MPVPTIEERIGSQLVGRHRLIEVLASGGMGVVYRGVDMTTGQRAAIKTLKPGHSLEPSRIARFLREARIGARVDHPNLVRVFDTGVDGDTPFIVMELLEGCSLEQELARRDALPFAEALAIVLPIARALSAAHACGIVHRDLKPSNIFLCRDGGGAAVPKLLDFGIAKDPAGDFDTQTGLVLGTPGYMAPEQARDGTCGAYTDVWGIAAVLYRSVMGNVPHASGSVSETLAKLMRDPVAPFCAPGLKKHAGAVVDRALDRLPERRYQTMDALIRELEALVPSGPSDSAGDESRELFTGTLELAMSPRAPAPAPELAGVAARPLGWVRPPWRGVALGIAFLFAAIFVHAWSRPPVLAAPSHLPSPPNLGAVQPPHPDRYAPAISSPTLQPKPAVGPAPSARRIVPPLRTGTRPQRAKPRLGYEADVGVPVVTEW